MGCGASNTLETSEFRNKEQQLKTNYMKIIENQKTIQQKTENNFEDACQNAENDADVDSLLKEMNESYPNIGLTPQEQKDCCLYTIARLKIGKEIMDNLKNNGEYITEMLSNSNGDFTSKIGKLFIENCGNEFKVLFINIESLPFIAKMIIQVLKYDALYSTYSTVVLLIPEILVDDEAFTKELGSLFKNTTSIKNFVLGISDEGKKPVAAFDNVSFIFEGIVLSKTLKNFGILRLMTNSFTLKPESVVKIASCIASCKLTSLGLANFGFQGEDRNKILEAFSKNTTLSLVGIQLLETTADDLNAILKPFVKAAALRWLICGMKVDDYEETTKKYEGVLKANPKVEGLVIDNFKN